MSKRLIALALSLFVLMTPIASYAQELEEKWIIDGGTIYLDRDVQEPLMDVYTLNGFHYKTNKVFYPATQESLEEFKEYVSYSGILDIQTHSHGLFPRFTDGRNIIDDTFEPNCYFDYNIYTFAGLVNKSVLLDITTYDGWVSDSINSYGAETYQFVKKKYVVDGQEWWALYTISVDGSYGYQTNADLVVKYPDGSSARLTITQVTSRTDTTYADRFNLLESLVQSIVRTFEPVQ